MNNTTLLIKKFIYSKKNLYGISVSSLVFIIYLLGFIEDYWWQIAIGFYFVVYLSTPKEKETVFIHIKGESFNDYKGFIHKLKENTNPYLKTDAIECLNKIPTISIELIDFIDKKPNGVDYLNEEIINLKNIFDKYLPNILNQYIKLPRRYAENVLTSYGKTSSEMLLEQLNIIYNAIEKIAFGLYENDVTNLKVYNKLLNDKFNKKQIFILEKEMNN